jgi:alkaline phosphatase
MARRITTPLLGLLAASALVASGCQTSATPAPKQTVMAWRPVVSFAGDADTQTDSFDIGTGTWRIKWETTDEPHSTDKKTFQVIVHSTISGRFVSVAVDHPSAGSGISYVGEDPRGFFLVVESSGLDWKVAVEEGAPVER